MQCATHRPPPPRWRGAASFAGGACGSSISNPVGALGGAERVLLELFSELPALDPTLEPILVAGGEGPLVEEARRLGVSTRVLPLPEALASLGDSAARFGELQPATLLTRMARQTPGLLCMRRAPVEAGAQSRPGAGALQRHQVPPPAALALPRRLPQLWHLHDFLGERPLAGRALRLLGDAPRSRWPTPRPWHVTRWRSCPIRGWRWSTTAWTSNASTPSAGRAPISTGSPDSSGGTGARCASDWSRPGRAGRDTTCSCAPSLARSPRGRVPMRAYVVGSPVYRTESSQFSPSELRALVAELGLGSRVGFVPFLERCEDVFRALDVVVHASTRPEPFGMTVIEGMASGRAVVVSRAGGAAELFEHGTDALGTPPGDVAALSAALLRLVRRSDPAHRSRDPGAPQRRAALQRGAGSPRACSDHYSRVRPPRAREQASPGAPRSSRPNPPRSLRAP